jgi:hypothetical protein
VLNFLATDRKSNLECQNPQSDSSPILVGGGKLSIISVRERTLDVIQAFYDAAMDESLWCVALGSLCEITKSQATNFWVLDGSEEPRLPTFTCINFDIDSIKEYLEHTASIDPTVQYLVRHPREPIIHDGLVITEREKDKHP